MKKPLYRPIDNIIQDLRAYKKKHGATQKYIAQMAKVSQSDVQRALAGKKRRLTGNFLKICEYAKIKVFLNSEIREVDPVYERRIQECITEVWDGSSRQGKVIVGVLNALKPAFR